MQLKAILLVAIIAFFSIIGVDARKQKNALKAKKIMRGAVLHVPKTGKKYRYNQIPRKYRRLMLESSSTSSTSSSSSSSSSSSRSSSYTSISTSTSTYTDSSSRHHRRHHRRSRRHHGRKHHKSSSTAHSSDTTYTSSH